MQTATPTKRKLNRRSAKQWRAILRRFDKSSLSPADFCRQQKLSLPAFRRWQRKQEAEVSTAGFVELQPPAAPTGLETSWTLELDLPGGGRLRIQIGL
jgi:hypothetical protein